MSTRWSAPEENSSTNDNKGDASQPTEKGRTYTVELPRTAGITWGSDISFRWIYVLEITPQSEAAQCGLIAKGDYIVGFGNTSVIAQDFDTVLNVCSSFFITIRLHRF
jgi:hypothetical protein